MELFTTVVLALVALVIGVGLVVYGIKGRRESQARDGRTLCSIYFTFHLQFFG